jgi:hypothetical protein
MRLIQMTIVKMNFNNLTMSQKSLTGQQWFATPDNSADQSYFVILVCSFVGNKNC